MTINPGWQLEAEQILLCPVSTVSAATAIACQLLMLVREWQWHCMSHMVFMCAPPGSRVIVARRQSRRRVSALVVEVGQSTHRGPRVTGAVSPVGETSA